MAVHRPRLRDGAAGRLHHGADRRLSGADRARPPGLAARVPQHLPASRLAHLLAAQGIGGAAGLPVSQLELRSRRPATVRPRRQQAVRRLGARAEADRLRERGWPGVRLPRQVAAGLRGVPRRHDAVFRAARPRQHQGRVRDHDSGERQLEAGLGEQPRVLSLLGQPSRALPLISGVADGGWGRRGRRRSRDRGALGADGGRGPAGRFRARPRRSVPDDPHAAAPRRDELHDVGQGRRRAAAVATRRRRRRWARR